VILLIRTKTIAYSIYIAGKLGSFLRELDGGTFLSTSPRFFTKTRVIDPIQLAQPYSFVCTGLWRFPLALKASGYLADSSAASICPV